jgi:hypothetical protein
MTLSAFKNQINDLITQHPNLKEEILDFYELAITEIEEGGSATHEIELCLNDIELLIEENK